MRNNNEARNQGDVIEAAAQVAYNIGDMSNNIAKDMMSHSSDMQFDAGFAISNHSDVRPFDGFADDGETITVVEIKNGFHDAFKKEVYIQQIITNAYAASIAFPTRMIKMVIIMATRDGKTSQIVVGGKTAADVKDMFFNRCIMSVAVEARAAAKVAVRSAERKMNFAEVADQQAIIDEATATIKAIKVAKEAHYSSAH